MIRIIPPNQRQYATKNTEHLASKVFVFLNICRLYIFYDSFQLKYVGAASYDSQKMLADISLILSNLQMVYNYRGRII